MKILSIIYAFQFCNSSFVNHVSNISMLISCCLPYDHKLSQRNICENKQAQPLRNYCLDESSMQTLRVKSGQTSLQVKLLHSIFLNYIYTLLFCKFRASNDRNVFASQNVSQITPLVTHFCPVAIRPSDANLRSVECRIVLKFVRLHDTVHVRLPS